jgi:uncharacterized protein YybS (DUF2232 family)
MFVPLPATFVGMRQGTGFAGGVVLLTLAGLYGVSGADAATAYLLQYGLGSWLLVALLRRKISWDRALAGSVLLTTVVAGSALVGYAANRHLAIGSMVEEFVQEETGRAIDLYRQAGMEAEQLQELQGVIDQISGALLQAWPALAIAVSAALLLLTLYLLSVLAKGRYEIPGASFRLWKAPEHLVWLLIGAGAGQLFTSGLPQQVSLNVLLIVLPVYFLQGLAIVNFYFRQRNVSPLFRSLGYLLITILNPLPLVVTGMGVFDLWVDFRKPRAPKNADP